MATDVRVSWVAELASLYLAHPEDQLLAMLSEGGEYSGVVREFLDCTTPTPALYLYLLSGRPVVATEPPTQSADYLVYFVRRVLEGTEKGRPLPIPETDDGPVTELTDELRAEFLLYFDVCLTPGNVLSSIAVSLENQYAPIIPGTDTEITFQSRKLAIAASATDAQLRSEYTIDVPTLDIGDPRVAAQDAMLVAQVQNLFEKWVPILQSALEAYATLSPRGDLPMLELESWRKRSALLSNLYEELCSPMFKKLLGVLEHSHSHVFGAFSYLRSEVARSCLESRDNARFLGTLERHFKLLARAPLPGLCDVVTSLYSALRMVWTISRYYNTEERLLPLMHRIAKQITQRVRNTIDISALFTASSRTSPLAAVSGAHFYTDGEAELKSPGHALQPNLQTEFSPIDNLYAAAKLLIKWKTQYNETRQQIEESSADTRRWELDKRVLFGETDFHYARVEALISCVEAVNEFSQIVSPDVQRVIGDASGLRDVKKTIAELPSELIALGSRIWLPSHSVEFDSIIDNFKQRVAATEKASFNYIDRSFARLRSVSSALDLIIKLNGMNPSAQDQGEQQGSTAASILSSHMHGKVEEVLRQYCEELRKCITEFERKKDQPPLGIDLPPLAASVVWARSLFVSVKGPHRVMKMLGETLLKTSQAATEAGKLFDELTSNLRAFEQKRFQSWRLDADQVILKSLRSPLLGEKRILNVSDLRQASNDPEGSFLPRLVIPNLITVYNVAQVSGQLGTTAGVPGSKDRTRRSDIRQMIPDSLPQHAAYADMTGATYLSPTVTSLILKEYGLELCVNFPPELNSLIDEVSALDRLGFRVGETALNVCLQKTKYELHAEGLKTLIGMLNSALQDFLPSLSSESSTKKQANSVELIRKSVTKAALVIRPGFGPLNWNSLSIDDYLDRAYSACSELSQNCQQILKTIASMEQCIKGITNTVLIPSQPVLLMQQSSGLPDGAPGLSGMYTDTKTQSPADKKPSMQEIMARVIQIRKRQQLEGKRPDSPTSLFLAAVKSLENRQAGEEAYEAIPTISLPEFTSRLEDFRTKALTDCLEKYYSLGPLLVKIEELSFGTSSGRCAGLKTYYEYWTNRVYHALVTMISKALLDFYGLLRGLNTQLEKDPAKRTSKYLKDRYVPLFQLSLSLSSPEIVVTPSLSSVLNVLTSQVEQITKVACPFVLWVPGGITMQEPIPATSAAGAAILTDDENATTLRRRDLFGVRQRAQQSDKQDLGEASSTEEVVVRSFSPRVAQYPTIISLTGQINSKIQQSIVDIQEYVQSWSHFEQLWRTPRLQIVSRFASQNPDASMFDYVLGFFSATSEVLKGGFSRAIEVYTDKQLAGLAQVANISPTTPDAPNRNESFTGNARQANKTAQETGSVQSSVITEPSRRHAYLPSNYMYCKFDLAAANDSLVDAIPVNNSISALPPFRILFDIAVVNSHPLVRSIIHECQLWSEAVCRVLIEKARPILLESYAEIDEEMKNCVAPAHDLESLKIVLSTLRRVSNRTMSMELMWIELENFFSLLKTYGAELAFDFEPCKSPQKQQALERGFTPEQLEQYKRDEALSRALQPFILEFENEELAPILDGLDLGWSSRSLRELISLSDTDPRLCNDEIGISLTSGTGGSGASLNSSIEALAIFNAGGDADGAAAGKSKKTAKTTNVRVFRQELDAAYLIRHRWDSLLQIVRAVDKILVETKRRQAEETMKLSRIFEKEMHAFITDFNEAGPGHYLTTYYSELEVCEAEGRTPAKGFQDCLEEVMELYKAYREKFIAIVNKRDATILAQQLFNLELVNSTGLTPVEKELDAEAAILEIYEQVRQTFREWNQIYFTSLDPTMLETGCDTLRATLRRLPADYRTHRMYETLDTILQNYKASVPLLQDLRNDALRPRHWIQVEQVTGQSLFSNAEQAQTLTLGQLTSLDLFKYAQQINEIVVGARKELSIEKGLADIAEVWTKTRLPVKRYENAKGKERGFILRSLDEILTMIEDNTMNLQSMSASKYVGHFASEVRVWEKRLSVISDVLEAWLMCQRQWLYLEGIFSGSEDLKVQLPEEANRFERIDNAYMKLMSEIAKTNASVLEAAQANGRLALLKSLVAQMETCQKALTDYLNGKRSLFTRFYFISDDELLFLLGNSSDPSQVQTHLRKMFEGVQSFVFQRGGVSTVTAVSSPEGELLPLMTAVKIDTSTMPLEVWMNSVDTEIRSSMRLHIKTGIFDFGQNYSSQTRVEWVKKHYGQVSLVASMIWWVFDAESAFKDLETGANMGSMKMAAARYTTQIENLVLEIRKALTKHERAKINTLIIEDMHNRDLLDKFVRDSVITASSFDWESQLRFYWDRLQDTIVVRQSSNSPILYSYEYLGLTTRLVLTPLTDRCIITINTALSNFLGGAPAGPAGTGKTESVKDLAKQLGIFCLIVNCSEGMDYRSFGAILSGISESGVWLCCDEFNRIDAPVLSVISGQIKIIQVGLMNLAKQMAEKGTRVGSILLEGREISLKPTASIFITMNPGYAGRTELPDNLKALFRPIIMTKPDNAIIAEVMFLAEGFLQSRVLSKKMTVLYQLASEQLSKQYHYDFGLRALKSVLVNAGKLKRSDPDANEELLLMQALRDMNLPKFIFEDVPLFMGLINDLCPGIKLSSGAAGPPPQTTTARITPIGGTAPLAPAPPIYTPEQEAALLERGPTTIQEAAYLAFKELNYEVLSNQILKVTQVSETLQARHSVMIVGPSQGGKSVILQAFAAANTKLGCKVTYTVLNPKAIPVSELYGILNPDTREWIDGLLSKIFRNINDPSYYTLNPAIAAAVETNPGSILMPILFDGDVDAVWIESMNSVMDDSKLLTLPNSERIRLQDWCKLLFEVSDLQYASPATVSRCGMVWVDTKDLSYSARYMRWVRERFDTPVAGEEQELSEEERAARAEIRLLILSLYTKYIPPLIDFTLNGVRINVGTGQPEVGAPLRLIYAISDMNLVSQFCNVFNDVIAKAEQIRVDEILVGHDSATEESTEAAGVREDSTPQFRFSSLTDPMIVEALFIFALVWSVGALVHEQDRTAFDMFLRELSGLPVKFGVGVQETVLASHLPGGAITASAGSTLGAQQASTLYDFYFDVKNGCWRPWSQFVRPYTPPPDGRFSSIVVATLDTVRNTWFLDTMVRNNRHVLFIGESGNAKTTIVRSFLKTLSPDHYITLGINFSSRTMSIDVQVALEDNLDRRAKDVLGPPGGRKMIFFTDELSMPLVDTYGTMQSIAAMKLLVESRGLFDRNPKSLMWRKIHDVLVLGCCKPVGGSSNKLDARFISNFSVLNISTPIEDSLLHIYNSILTTHMKNANYHFDPSGDQETSYRYIDTISNRITSATLSVYNGILQGLSPTPSRFHYLFNLRDLSRVYEGLCMALPEKFKSFASLVKLWRNEMVRVFSDRLICAEDHAFVAQKIGAAMTEFFSDVEGMDSAINDPLIYGDFRELPLLIDNYEAVHMGVEPENKCFRLYEELIDGAPIQKDLVDNVEEPENHEADGSTNENEAGGEDLGGEIPGSQPEVNEPSKKAPVAKDPYSLVRQLGQMGLDAYNRFIRPPLVGIVLFDDALAHLVRIHRALRTPRGSILLVGYGGSGRRSLTRLATFMCGYDIFEITLSRSYGETEFKEDLKDIYRRLAPPQNAHKQLVFLFTDQHVAEEGFLEYINSILTTGCVPALFSDDERDGLVNQIRSAALADGCPDTRDSLWAYFVNSCRDRLHIVLSMNPVGETLRKRCRNFPGLVSSCVIDWFTSWNNDALRSVARYTLEVSDHQKIDIVEQSVFVTEGDPDSELLLQNKDRLQELRTKLMDDVIELCIAFHKHTVELSETYWTSIRRQNFVTPRNFVDFLQTYLRLLQDRRAECDEDIGRFTQGLQKLSQAESEVTELQKTLNEQSVILEEKTEACNKMVAQIEKQSAETAILQKEAAETETELKKQEQEITVEKGEAEEQLAAAIPALEAAEEALNKLDPLAIAEIRAFTNPPNAVRQISECVVVFMKQDTDPNWTKAKSLMSGNFIMDLKTFDKTLLRDKTVKYVETKYLARKDFGREVIEKVSKAGLCLYDWVTAMVKYYAVAKDVEPKRKRVAKLEEQLEQSSKELAALQEKILVLEEESNKLRETLLSAQQEQQELADSAALMAKRLDAAKRLITGLGTEKVRWGEAARKLREDRKKLVGDCLITAANLSYSGGFTYEFRLELVYEKWCLDLVDRQIPSSIVVDEKAIAGDAALGQAGMSKRVVSRSYKPELLLTTDVEILKWSSDGLPTDELSIQNGTLITQTPKWPYIVDPQLQINRWIKEKEKANRLIIRSVNDDDVVKQLELAITYGAPFLLESCMEQLDPILTPILEKDIRDSAGRKYIILGDKEVDYDPNFKLYMTSKLPNPSLSPDLFGIVTVVNHLVTESGLENQLLNAVVRRERPDLEAKRMNLVRNMSQANSLLKTLEETLLRELTSATGVIVDNIGLIQTLESTKSKAIELQQNLEVMTVTAAEIDTARSNYTAAARRGTCCFFVMSALSTVSSMYQYSLQAFNDIFSKSLTEAQTDPVVEVRLSYIIERLTENVYSYVSTSLFERHKLMFSFQLCTRIISTEYPEGTIPPAELSFFVKGDISLDQCTVPCPHSWISASSWKDLVKLHSILTSLHNDQSLEERFIGTVKQRRNEILDNDLAKKFPVITSEIFKDLLQDITANEKEWRRYWDNDRPELIPLPSIYSENPFITDMQKLCILRCLRPDRVYVAVQLFVSNILGEKYVSPPVTLYDNIYKQSSRSTPMLFILSPGSDPIVEITKLAQKHDFYASRFKFVALGQGQSPVAEAYLKQAILRGHWVLLMNCHLLPKWLPTLEKILELPMNAEQIVQMQQQIFDAAKMEAEATGQPIPQELIDNQVINLINKQVNPEFRIFLTTEPTDNFPLSIVSNSIKITTEPPSSLRLNMMQTFSKVTEEQLMECPSPYFRPLVYTLAFFHATIQERQKFGKLGWNVKYDFNASDFVISFELLKTFLTKAFLAGKEIPWSSLKYLIGLCMYGGRVSDNFDRRVLSTYMDEYLGDFLFDTHNPFSYYGKKEGNDFNYAPPPVVTSASGGNQVVVLTELVTKLIKYSIAENGTQGLPGWTPQMSATNEAQVTDYINTVLKEMTTVKECYETFYISRIPLLTSPQIFGLHTNAEISYLETAAREMCVCLAELQPRSSSGETVSKEDFLIDLCKILEGRVPPQFDLPQIRKKFKSLSPTDIVLLQEIERFNILVKVISSSVAELQKALSGEIGMSEQLDSIATSFFIGQIPHNWLRFAPQTLKMLSSWIQHLLRRAEQYKVWHTQGEPAVMWLSGLHIPESYLTALVQITSRAKRWPLDKSALFTTVTKYIQAEDVSEKLEFGCYISGLFLEGAAWDTTKDCLTYSKKKELITQLPLVQIVPAEASRIKLRNQFKAPVYVTTARTNAAGQGLVFSADLSSYEHDSLWILQGVAVILNDN
ncbi:IAD-1alpha dynein heavy chain [Giardia muris]|uniref:IAD-1alpha dynein heavy chain n=1 Tax=Giardia muris TaxID=5742 RepID=A0A4Z1T248_GIAMU|nr:IAD-1alpha dynein heavy chain [Giardia muris]|eukprot:TNJ29738.1 IAD-1alpha dynein heavy chain [Giardia muris]